MIIIGELINATRQPIAQALEKKDKEFIAGVVQKQVEAGVDFIDLNAGTGKGQERELRDMEWLIDIVKEYGNIPICLDSSDPSVIESCMDKTGNPNTMINSITGESGRIEQLLPAIRKNNHCKVIGLTMDDSGIPVNADKRVAIASKIITVLEEAGVIRENIFIDALLQPVSVDVKNANVFLESIKSIKAEFPEVKTTCGLSNVSFGLPNRKLVNKYFLALAIAGGLDSAIADLTDKGIGESVYLSELLTGKDEYCMNYIKMCREQ